MLVAACAANPHSLSKVAAASQPATRGAGCLDTLHAADSLPTIVKMTVASQDPRIVLPGNFESFFVEEFRSHFKVPASLPQSVVMGSQPCDSLGSRCMSGVLSMGTIAYATAHNDGRLSDIEVLDVALTPRFPDGVKSALQSMSRAEMVPAVGDVDSIPLILQIEQEEKPDTVSPVRYLFRAKVPRYNAPFSYASLPATGVDARYPFNARVAGVRTL